jgi:hypothetical protein
MKSKRSCVDCVVSRSLARVTRADIDAFVVAVCAAARAFLHRPARCETDA